MRPRERLTDVMSIQLPNASKLAWLAGALLLIVAPICYAQAGWAGLAWGMAFGLINGLPSRGNFVTGVAVGLLAGSTLNPSFSLVAGAGFGFLATFVTGLAPALASESEVDRQRLFIASVTGLCLGGIIGVAFMFARGFWEALPLMVALAVTSAVATPLGALSGVWLRPKLLKFGEVWLYLREMGVFLVGFTVGYLALALLFAGWFWSVWKVWPADSFNISADATFGDFFYFSIVTIATLGYGDITPKSAPARALVLSEVVVGVGWITVVFAAVMSHLQPRLADVAGRQRARLKELQEEAKYAEAAPELYTIMVSDTEAGGKGVYATISNDYAKNGEGKPLYGKEYGFYLWGTRVRGAVPKATGFRTAKEAEAAAKRLYKGLGL